MKGWNLIRSDRNATSQEGRGSKIVPVSSLSLRPLRTPHPPLSQKKSLHKNQQMREETPRITAKLLFSNNKEQGNTGYKHIVYTFSHCFGVPDDNGIVFLMSAALPAPPSSLVVKGY